jgi:hypothetical protein
LQPSFYPWLKEARPAQNIVLRPYDPGYTPDWNELAYVDLQDNEEIAELIGQISQVQEAEMFREQDEIVDHLRFYAIVVSPNAQRHAVFFRTYSPKKELTRRAGFATLLSRGRYDKVGTKIFLFDRQVDCFSWGGYLFIDNVSAFQRIFKYFEQLREKANETVTTILERIPISDADAFRAAGTGQMQMMSKLARCGCNCGCTLLNMANVSSIWKQFSVRARLL